MTLPIIVFKQECQANITKMSGDEKVQKLSREWICESARYKYSYNFSWMGRPIIRYPQDMIAMQIR